MGDPIGNSVDDPVRVEHGWPALDALVTKVVETRKAIAALESEQAQLLASAVDLVLERTTRRRVSSGRVADADLPLREVCAELAAAMRISDRAVQGRMGDATTLTMRFPATLTAWGEGRVDAGHVRAIVEAGAPISDPDARAEFERRALSAADTETPSRLRPIARIIAARVEPSLTDDRYRRAVGMRGVRLTALDDGMARLTADLPAVLAHAIHDRLTQMAHTCRIQPDAACVRVGVPTVADRQSAEPLTFVTGPSVVRSSLDDALRTPDGADDPTVDTRVMDELRADIFTDLLLTAVPTAHGTAGALDAIAAHVQVTVPVLTLAGIGNEPALLSGYGPIDRETARRLAGTATGWDRVMFHPHTGEPLAVDRYRPSADLRRFLRVRDERCRFPGCSQPPWRCDIDHTVDAARGGPTTSGNLADFCRRHHVVKHHTDWTVRQLPGGRLEWTSPTGRRYVDRAPATVCFVPSPLYDTPVTEDPAPF